MSKDTALVIIDMQVNLLAGSYKPDEVLGNINTLIAKAHEAGAPVVYVQHDGGKGHGLEVGTPGWEIHPAITPREGDQIVHKQASDSFHRTTLQQVLDERGIKHIVVVGGQTEYCVDTSVRRATTFGYDVTLVGDAHTTEDCSMATAEYMIAYTNDMLYGFSTDDAKVTIKPTSEVSF